MQDEIVPADKRQRRQVIVAMVVLGAVGLAVLFGLERQIDQIQAMAEKDLPAAAARMTRLVAILSIAGGIGFVGAGAWFWRLGRRIRQSGCFPPPGMRVIKDTPMCTGAKARTRAHVAQAAALGCVIVGTLGMWYLYHVAASVLRL